MNQPAQTTPFEMLGGAEGVRRLVDRFYDVMEADPQYAGIRGLHPADMTGSRDKLYLYLTGWFGGPPVYVERYGHPRLRARHLPFPIGTPERDAWLACMETALADAISDAALRETLMQAFAGTADWMRNKPD